MRTFALVLALLPLGACSWFGLDGKSSYRESGDREIKSVSSLERTHKRNQFFGELRRRNDGRNNAFGRDLMAIQDFIDRHVWNYNQNDPYVNYSNDTTKLGHVGRFGLMQASTVPGAPRCAAVSPSRCNRRRSTAPLRSRPSTRGARQD
ncbi:MAG: hypothetical protein ACK5BN_20195, partial [Planctomycetota bacterium]